MDLLLRALPMGLSFVLCASCLNDWAHGRQRDAAVETDAGTDDAGEERPVDGEGSVVLSADAATLDACGDHCAEDACRPWLQRCAEGCVDLESDPFHCGACDRACAGTLACAQSQCVQTVSALVLGDDRSCALLADEPAGGGHSLRCWGSPSPVTSLFRDPTVLEANAPRPVAGVPSVRALTMTRERQCAVAPESDTVRCWGSCASECGLASQGSEGATLTDVSLPGVLSISTAMGTLAGTGNTCGLTGSGGLSCWGAPQMITAPDGKSRSYPWRIAAQGIISRTYRAVAGNYGHTCAVSQEGWVACWGFSADALGVPHVDQPPVDAVFVQVEDGSLLSGVSAIDVAGERSCAVTTSRELWCWGRNEVGQLGVGDTRTDVLYARKVPLSDVVQVAVGGLHACAVTGDGRLHCWGAATRVGLGVSVVGDAVIEGDSYVTSPRPVPGLVRVVEVRAGNNHSCARLGSGAVLCWGDNSSGQLGDGTRSWRYTPTSVVDLLE
jgi:Regulator of chromosome condensation (RCC1) repeat